MKQFLKYLEEQATCLRQEAQRLAGDDRKDEGDLTKIRANVYGICKSLLGTLGREKGVNATVGLQNTWCAALDEAESHGDVKKAAIETIKLETLAAILKKLEEE